MSKSKEGNHHAMRLSTWYECVLVKVKAFLKKKRYRGKDVSTAKAIEFLLDVYNGNEQMITQRYFKDEPEVLSSGEVKDVVLLDVPVMHPTMTNGVTR